MKAQILSIGDEILIGQIINTNAAWMATELNACGVFVERIVTVSDNHQVIAEALCEAMQVADLILITGGLGPTKDDLTKKTLADLFGHELIYHDESFQNIVRLFEQFGRNADDRYKLQAYMPSRATILINKVGTASGMWFEEEGKIIVSMPGVPREMQYLMSYEVLPRLQARKDIPAIEHYTITSYGKGETDLSELLEDFEAALPPHIKLAYLPNTTTGYVRLRLTGRASDRDALRQEVELNATNLKAILGQLAIGRDEEPLERVLGEMLRQKGLTLSTAESCTGGNIAHKITAIAGSSSYFLGSVVAYSNEVKEKVLGVKAHSLEQYGAVSEETISQMAMGVKALMGSDCAIATSGIAGPDGGRPDKPVGTIWVAIAYKEQLRCKKLQLGKDRNRNIELASNIAMNMLRLMLQSQGPE